MAFWHRIGKSNLKTIACIQFSRCYIHPPPLPPHASLLNSIPKSRPNEIPHPYSFFHSVRFYAAPVQAKSKDEDEDSGPRLNDQIKARYVRLVLDDGKHSVVSFFDALERAKNLKLDLVEVQKNANPPVCRIMDFHKETYKRQEKDKERAKSKAGVSLRSECKEMRISVKTESKDISMKAEMVKKLMEKGYRVKCRATGKEGESEDMLASVSRLLDQMKDVCIVESGPHLTKKDAFIIVRHVRYGPAKKGTKKLQDPAHMAVKAEEGDAESLTASSSAQAPADENNVQSNAQVPPAVTENRYKRAAHENKVRFNAQVPPAVTENRYKRAADENKFRSNAQVPPAVTENRYKRAADENNSRSNAQVPPAVIENRYKRAADENNFRSNAQVPPVVTENRYKRAEPGNRYQQTPPNTGPDRRIPLNLNRTRHATVDANANPVVENTRQPFNGPPGSTSPGYGRFNPNGPQTAGMHRNREGNS